MLRGFVNVFAWAPSQAGLFYPVHSHAVCSESLAEVLDEPINQVDWPAIDRDCNVGSDPAIPLRCEIACVEHYCQP